jgi:HAD superfamily hydrolase (TIGR01509 family)
LADSSANRHERWLVRECAPAGDEPALTPEQAEKFQKFHSEAYLKQVQQVQPLPGAKELLESLAKARVKWAIATSGPIRFARPSLDALEVPSSVPVITRDQVERAQPDPDLFLAAAAKLRVGIANSIVVGDSVWDLLAARRARALGVGVLSGGYGQDELERAGAYRVYQDPYDLLKHLNELGVRTSA